MQSHSRGWSKSIIMLFKIILPTTPLKSQSEPGLHNHMFQKTNQQLPWFHMHSYPHTHTDTVDIAGCGMKGQQWSKPKPTLSHTVSDLTHQQLWPKPQRVEPVHSWAPHVLNWSTEEHFILTSSNWLLSSKNLIRLKFLNLGMFFLNIVF